jgi:hypothetical protein
MTEVAAARNNNLVAESDLDAALHAVDRHLHNHGRVGKGTLDETTRLALQASLHAHIQRIVQPVTDEAFHLYVHRNTLAVDQDTTTTVTGTTDTTCSTATGTTIDTTTRTIPRHDPYGFAESELLDVEALERVQALRTQVRDEAARIHALQTSVLERAAQLASRQTQLQHCVPLAVSNHAFADTNQDERVDKIRVMQQALTTMQQALQQTQQALPTHHTSLQTTITAIELDMDKQNRHGLSQTELAITQREKDTDMDSAAVHPQALLDLPPMTRLANFLRD